MLALLRTATVIPSLAGLLLVLALPASAGLIVTYDFTDASPTGQRFLPDGTYTETDPLTGLKLVAKGWRWNKDTGQYDLPSKVSHTPGKTLYGKHAQGLGVASGEPKDQQWVVDRRQGGPELITFEIHHEGEPLAVHLREVVFRDYFNDRNTKYTVMMDDWYSDLHKGRKLIQPIVQSGAGMQSWSTLGLMSNDGADRFMVQSLTIETVPEPGTLGLIAVGGLAVAALRRRQQPSVVTSR